MNGTTCNKEQLGSFMYFMLSTINNFQATTSQKED